MTQKFISKKLALTFLSILCAFSMGQAVADTAVQAVVQSYKTTSSLQNGMVVKLDSKDASSVDPATLADIKKMTGVVVAPGDAAVSLSSTNNTSQQVFVATSGRYNVLVSNQNGVINIGDYVTISSLDGVAMKADSSESQVLGKAVAAFDGEHNVSGTTNIKGQGGKTETVTLGRIPVDITVALNPYAVSTSNVPGFLQRAGSLVTDKPVSAWRLWGGLVIVIGTLFVAGSLLYSGVRNGMVAIGRNPLARKSITRNLTQVIVVSLAVLVVGALGSYLLLKL